MTFQIVQQLGGALQVIALDHADFEDNWFSGSVVQRWRGGQALVPADWLVAPADGAESPSA
ncbi:MAG: DUF3732 domain-containing protein [Solirubrobacteraceae bacterium]